MQTQNPPEYQVVFLDETKKLAILEGAKPLGETNDLHEAINMMNYVWESQGSEVAVWQPRTQGFRDYKKFKQLPKRAANGQFAKTVQGIKMPSKFVIKPDFYLLKKQLLN
jgi:hypothetical protein